MKAWEKHQVDLYLLANDILENLYYQQHGYKSVFYYDFNPKLKFLQSDGSRRAQLKLLSQLADKDVLTYAIKTPGEYTTDEMISRSVTDWGMHKELIHLRINPRVFNEVYPELAKYRPAEPSAPKLEKDIPLQLRKVDNKLYVRVNGDKEYLLKKFKPGLPPDEIFTWLINRWPNTRVTRVRLEADAGIRVSRKLSHIVDKSLTPVARDLFMAVSLPDALQVRTDVIAERPTVELLLSELSI